MAKADSGGFDLGLHVALDGLCTWFGSYLGRTEADFAFPVILLADLVKVHLKFEITDVSVSADATISVTASTAGTTITWPEEFEQPFTDPSTTYELACEVTIAAKPVANGTRLELTFPADAVKVTIAPGTLEAIPGIHAWLAMVEVTFGPVILEVERGKLYRVLTDGIPGVGDGIAGLINGLLPDSVPVGVLPGLLVTDVKFAGGNGHDLRTLLTLTGGTPGLPDKITRSPIARTSAGEALDIAGIVVGNNCLLRKVMRPILQHGLQLPVEGFDSGHPCHWWGATPMPPAAEFSGLLPLISAVHGGIDETGLITASIDFSGTYFASLNPFNGADRTPVFGVTGSIRVGLTAEVVEPPTGGDGRILRLSIKNSFFANLDLKVEAWVYLALLAAGSGILAPVDPLLLGPGVAPILALVVGLLDAFGGGVVGGTIDQAIRGAIERVIGSETLDLPLPPGPIQPKEINLAQPGPPQSWKSQRYGITMSDYPENDAIITFTSA